jgi:hypothetical protein
MTCAGDCFDLAAPPSCQGEGSSESPMSSGITSLPHFTYSPLQPRQTRILRLHPRETHAGDQDNNSQLGGDLLNANSHALDGVTVEGDSNIISNTALSHSWGRPELLDVLLCNGLTRPISRSNAAALKALRHPTQLMHLWIDAVCINQEDVQEKSRQVAEMLLIYKKAQSVTAWLGEADDAGLLALACIRNPAALSALTSGFRERSHGASCLDSVEGNVEGFALLLRETVAPAHLDPARDRLNLNRRASPSMPELLLIDVATCSTTCAGPPRTTHSDTHGDWLSSVLPAMLNCASCLQPRSREISSSPLRLVCYPLPMLIHATQDDDGTAGGLFNPEDPYGKLSHGAIHSQRHRPWTPVLLCPILWTTRAIRTLLVRCQSVFFYCLVHALLPRPVERAQWPTGPLSVRSNPLFDSVLYLRAFLAEPPWSLICRLFILGSHSLPVVRNLLIVGAWLSSRSNAKMRARADHGTKTEKHRGPVFQHLLSPHETPSWREQNPPSRSSGPSTPLLVDAPRLTQSSLLSS